VAWQGDAEFAGQKITDHKNNDWQMQDLEMRDLGTSEFAVELKCRRHSELSSKLCCRRRRQ